MDKLDLTKITLETDGLNRCKNYNILGDYTEMQVGRNDLCPCGSGKKYKYCCLKNENKSEYELIREIIVSEKYDLSVAEVLCNLYRYMMERQLWGGCHALCSVLYIALSELGYSPKLCIGEVVVPSGTIFDHSWILLDNKVIDLALALTLKGCAISNPIILDKDIYTKSKHKIQYGIRGRGLDNEARKTIGTPFSNYMNDFPFEKNGLWDVLKFVYPKDLDIEKLKIRYADVKREYVIES